MKTSVMMLHLAPASIEMILNLTFQSQRWKRRYAITLAPSQLKDICMKKESCDHNAVTPDILGYCIITQFVSRLRAYEHYDDTKYVTQ
jgi:hypothetical protein